MVERHPPWDNEVIQGVADVLGGTATGLTGTEIGKLLAELRILDPGPEITKRIHLGNALLAGQTAGRASNCVIAFITRAMAPVRYRDNPGLRTLRQHAQRSRTAPPTTSELSCGGEAPIPTFSATAPMNSSPRTRSTRCSKRQRA